MAILPNNSLIKSNMDIETTTFVLKEKSEVKGTKVLYGSLKNSIFNDSQRVIHLNKLEDCYYLVYKNLLNMATPNQAAEYSTLLKINQEDYRLTVLQIELGEKNGH